MTNQINLFSVLLARLDWPLRPVKIMACRAIAKLMQTDDQDQFRPQFFEWMASRETETESVKALLILSLLDKPPFADIKHIQRHLSKPSLLSDIYLRLLFPEDDFFSEWSQSNNKADFKPDISMEEFKKVIRMHAAPIFEDRFSKLTNMSGFPFLERWLFEYMNYEIQDRSRYPSSSYFSRNHRYAYVDIETREGDIIPSAWLRTIQFAMEYWGLPPEIAIDLATYAAPANIDLAKTDPSARPAWWPSGIGFTGKSDQEILADLVKIPASTGDEIILAASGHIILSETEQLYVRILSNKAEPSSDILDIDYHYSLLHKQTDAADINFTEMPSDSDIENNDYSFTTFYLNPAPRWHLGFADKNLFLSKSSGNFVNKNGIVWKYWYDPFRQEHPSGTGHPIGTALILSLTQVREDKINHWSVLCRKSYRENTYDEWQHVDHHAIATNNRNK